MRLRIKHKKSTKQLALAPAGCVWKNPQSEVAARLIGKDGLKGKRVNGAEISAKHANLIVNRGGAIARAILALMARAGERGEAHVGLTIAPQRGKRGDQRDRDR